MNRRNFVQYLSMALPLTALSRHGGAREDDSGNSPGWRTFEMVTEVEPAVTTGDVQLWLPVPLPDPTAYQRRLELRWDAGASGRAQLASIPGYDVQLLHVNWSDATPGMRVTVTSRVATRDHAVDLSARQAHAAGASAETLQAFLRPTAYLPTDGIVKATAEKAVGGKRHDVDKAHALYEWIVENTYRDPATQGCGVGDVGAMLESGNLGGKCADINGLFVAMARAVGIPARDLYGVRVADSRLGYQCLGKRGDVTRAQHCRAEFYAQNLGWVPVDPADVRKVMLEEVPEGLALSDPRVQAARARLFGSWEMNWVAYNRGHDLALPGSAGKPVAFLMYPQGEHAGHRLNSLDAASFRYSITAREITAA